MSTSLNRPLGFDEWPNVLRCMEKFTFSLCEGQRPPWVGKAESYWRGPLFCREEAKWPECSDGAQCRRN